MRKTLFATCLLIATATQAQVLYVNNSNGTYQAFDTKTTESITFDEEQKLVSIELGSDDGILKSRFNTTKVTNIAPSTANATELTYDLDPTVVFDKSDETGYNEVVETIITDETVDESGDFVENFSTTRVITITFSETGVMTSALPDDITATIDGGHIVINSERSKVAYRVTGTCSNGSLKIYSLKKFQIMLHNLNLTNPAGPAINVQSGKTVYLTLLTGTVNTLCDGATYSAPAIAADGTEEDQKGTLFSEGQIIINGIGTLNVTSLGGHAICSDDYIRVRSGNINIVKAAKDGFRTKDKFIVGRTAVAAPTININATNNGIDCSEGTLTIEAGKLEIASGSEAIKVEYEEVLPDPLVIPDAIIKGGFVKIHTTGEKSSAIKVTRNYTQSGGIIQATVDGNGSKIINCDGNATFSNGKVTAFANGTVATDTTSAGGIKCNGNIEITGGTIAIECNGKGSKGINCSSDVTVTGGELTLTATTDNYTDIADDKKSRAITATGNVTVSGGKVVASAYDNAIHATAITVNDGIVNAYSKSSGALGVDAVQNGGWLLTNDAE